MCIVLFQHENSWPFRKPVDKEKVRDYYEVIKHPMDLESVQKKVNEGIKPRSQEEVKKPPVDDEMIGMMAANRTNETLIIVLIPWWIISHQT